MYCEINAVTLGQFINIYSIIGQSGPGGHIQRTNVTGSLKFKGRVCNYVCLFVTCSMCNLQT